MRTGSSLTFLHNQHQNKGWHLWLCSVASLVKHIWFWTREYKCTSYKSIRGTNHQVQEIRHSDSFCIYSSKVFEFDPAGHFFCLLNNIVKYYLPLSWWNNKNEVVHNKKALSTMWPSVGSMCGLINEVLMGRKLHKRKFCFDPITQQWYKEPALGHNTNSENVYFSISE